VLWVPDPEEGPVVLDRRPGVSGELVLRRHGGHHELVVDGSFLMDTRDGRSERALARCALVAAPRPHRVLVGGLGMGFTLAEALADPRVRRVDVVELEPVLFGWHRRFLGQLSGAALADPRTHLQVGDVVAEVEAAPPGSWDAVCLDVDNGPDWLARPQNAALYRPAGLRALARSLDPNGALAVWSADPAPRLAALLGEVFADVRAVPVASRTARPDWVLLALSRPAPRRASTESAAATRPAAAARRAALGRAER
jgi:spermidine synthase